MSSTVDEADRLTAIMIGLRVGGMRLDEKLKEAKDDSDRKEMIIDFIKCMARLTAKIQLPPFQPDWTWFNVSRPLTLDDLRGRITILDFFTYCCINCMHILPDLEALESRFPAQNDGVLVIGVHSPKFEHERSSSNVRKAIQRYNIHHPVVNDPGTVLWQALGIACWPTLLLIGPDGKPIRMFMGEGNLQAITEFIEVAMDYMQPDHANAVPIPKELASQTSILGFPGKVHASGDRLFISDTAHNRIVVTELSGKVLHIIGSGQRGSKDGSFEQAQFKSPQGLCVQEPDLIYVADTDNHLLRLINLSTKEVTTLAGTGERGHGFRGGRVGVVQPIASPWDVCLGWGPVPDFDSEPNVVYIAMAGTHQVWAYIIRPAKWWKNVIIGAESCIRVAGSGKEENRNTSYPAKAGFAQPSGIAYCQQNHCLFVADSESSSIRRVNLEDGAVKAVVGGELDPMNLFAYGDNDGVGTFAKLQHPLGVSWSSEKEILFIMDTYNNKIKFIDDVNKKRPSLRTKEIGRKGQDLAEAGGLSYNSKDNRVYVADTNNHRIVAIDHETNAMYEVPIEPISDVDGVPKKYDIVFDEEVYASPKPSDIHLTVEFNLPEGFEFNKEAPNSYRLDYLSPELQEKANDKDVEGKISIPFQTTLTYDVLHNNPKFNLVFNLYFCEKSTGVCLAKSVLVRARINLKDDAQPSITVTVPCNLCE